MKQITKDYKGVTLPIATAEKLEAMRDEIADTWEREHGVKLKLTLAGMIEIATKFYVQHRETAKKLNYEKAPKK
jgi:hypothetical protein